MIQAGPECPLEEVAQGQGLPWELGYRYGPDEGNIPGLKKWPIN